MEPNLHKIRSFFYQFMVVHSSKEQNLNNSVMPINSLYEVLDTKNEVLKQLNLVSEFSWLSDEIVVYHQKRKRKVAQIISKHPTVVQTIHPQPKPNTKNSTHMSWIGHASWLWSAGNEAVVIISEDSLGWWNIRVIRTMTTSWSLHQTKWCSIYSTVAEGEWTLWHFSVTMSLAHKA